MIPPFTEDGLLPPGVHTATLAEFEERFVSSTSSSQRRELWVRLRELLLDAMRTVLVREIYVAGSFVTSKHDPNDFDCLLVSDGSVASAEWRPFEYNILSRRAARRRYRGDVFSAPEGSWDCQRWLTFFQRNRDKQPVGIVKVTP